MDDSTPTADAARECYEIVEDPKAAQSPGSKPLVRAWWHACDLAHLPSCQAMTATRTQIA